jgi:hypothetical protein
VKKSIEAKLYRVAAGLFDEPSDVKDLDKDEYVRGMAELIADLTGTDKYDVVEKLRQELGGHLLTKKDFGTGINGDLLYIGPLEIALEFIKGPNKSTYEVTHDAAKGRWRVELDEGNVFGVADTEELAWRYALAAELGPIDEEFEPFVMHK